MVLATLYLLMGKGGAWGIDSTVHTLAILLPVLTSRANQVTRRWAVSETLGLEGVQMQWSVMGGGGQSSQPLTPCSHQEIDDSESQYLSSHNLPRSWRRSITGVGTAWTANMAETMKRQELLSFSSASSQWPPLKGPADQYSFRAPVDAVSTFNIAFSSMLFCSENLEPLFWDKAVKTLLRYKCFMRDDLF